MCHTRQGGTRIEYLGLWSDLTWGHPPDWDPVRCVCVASTRSDLETRLFAKTSTPLTSNPSKERKGFSVLCKHHVGP